MGEEDIGSGRPLAVGQTSPAVAAEERLAAVVEVDPLGLSCTQHGTPESGRERVRVIGPAPPSCSYFLPLPLA